MDCKHELAQRARRELNEMQNLVERFHQEAKAAQIEAEQSKKAAMETAAAETSQKANDFMRHQEQLAEAER